MSRTASVAVVIPAKDRAHVLGDALRSVLAQTVRPQEIFVIDDGSSDETASVARSFGAEVISHPEPRGSGPARNTGILAATSDWIALLDSDDVWLPEHLEYVCAHMGDHAIVSAAAVDTNGRGRGNVTGRPLTLTSARCFAPETPIVTSAVLVDRRRIVEAGLFGSFARAQDADMFARLLEHGTGVALPRPTVVYRVPAPRRERSATPKDLAGLQEVLTSLSGRPWMTDGVLRVVRCRLQWDEMRRALVEGERVTAARAALWIVLHPSTWPALVQILRRRRRARDPRWQRVLERATLT